jgi:N-acetyl-gamma-glutamyl-phosphate/LysW-gamma-L-alpha-aminoadipyl-6-phosphate reductase
MILALMPLARAGLIKRAIADLKVGSSEAGAEASESSHHPIRSGATRTFSVGGHRHLAEVAQELGPIQLDATVTSIDLVRGVLCTAHVEPTRPVDDREVRRLYREAYEREPFVRVVAERSGLHRLPDPKAVVGSNFADVGFAVDGRSGRIVALCAIDNLVKGAAGSAIQALNVALGLDEREGLRMPGVFPV